MVDFKKMQSVRKEAILIYKNVENWKTKLLVKKEETEL